MMILIMSILITQVVWAESADFYHRQTTEFTPPTHLSNNSYFGFSTTYDRVKKKIIISAPTADTSGIVYECDSSQVKCVKINAIIDKLGGLKNEQDCWFGASVAAGSTFIVACAPRLSKKIGGTAMMNGQCYMRRNNETEFTVSLKTPTLIRNPSISLEQSMETLGWSLDIADNDYLIVGGPGMYQKTGLAAVLKPSKLTSNNMQLERFRQIKAAFNFGYSVAVGYFFDQNRICFAVGSTYGQNGVGKVYFYDFHQNGITLKNILKTDVHNNRLGSMFGAVLCAANLHKHDNNKPMDLLVGAPTYASPLTYNAGAVFVYIQKKGPQFQRKIISQKSGSFFGSAIVTVGDLNDDGHDEIAIGAPYEDGVGAVYIYSGAELISDKSEQNLAHLQKITPSDSGYHSFAFSLSVIRDEDKIINGCNALVVGSPFDDRVNVYSCMAAITITKITVDFPKLQNRSEENFNFTVCIHMKYPNKPTKIIAEISTNVSLKHVSAYLSRPNKDNLYNFVTDLRDKQAKYCEEIEFTLPENGNYGTQIRYEVSTKLLNDPMKKIFDSSRVILSDTSVFSYKDAIWATDCAGNECMPILHMNISSDIRKPFIIGSKETETFRIDVYNSGEVAYDPCIQLKVDSVLFYQPPTDCVEVQDLEGVYECTYRKPIKTANTWSIDDITLNLKGLTNRNTKFSINATLFNHCKDYNKTRVSVTYIVELESHYAGVDIKGSTNLGDVINMNKEDLRDGKEFEHIYTITNNGMTNFENMTTEIEIIKEDFMTYPANPVSSHKENNNKRIDRDCETTFNDNTTLIAECKIDNLPKTHFFQIRIAMIIKPDYLVYDNLLIENVTQSSKLTLKIDAFENTGNTTTIIRVYETAVELWIIIIAGFVGILLIVILIIALYMCGCLTRHKKKELKVLKERIKRESIRRSMRHAPRGEGSSHILDQDKEESTTEN